MRQHTQKHWLAGVLASILVGACVTYTGLRPSGHVDRGLKFNHPFHAEKGVDCTSCHDMAEGGKPMPDHDVCSVCHDINVEKPDPEACGHCHTKAEFTVEPRVSLLTPELRLSHDKHTAAGVECAKCHADPDTSPFPKGPLMTFCTDCHGKTRPELNDCAVCHTEISKSVKPTSYRGGRIPHDAPQVWEHVHGQESRNHPEFCALCHESETMCEDCHRKNPPSDHTVAWRRKSHGLRASWDRAKCSVCHEEDSCLKCHQNTKPTSHRGGWDRPLNGHCLSCHYAPERTNCTVCHESIEHRTALPSPHDVGLFPGKCALCHPGGLPHRAPHVVNSTIRCTVCH